MSTTSKLKWRRADVVAYPEPGPTAPGLLLGNMAIVKDDRKFSPWRAVHQPSGLAAGSFRTRTAARLAVEAVRDAYGLEILDRAANATYSAGEQKLIWGPIKGIFREHAKK